MICKTCNTNIPTQFQYSIDNNLCPACGKKLMSEGMMRIFSDLKNNLKNVGLPLNSKSYAKIATFLISNYEVRQLTAGQSNMEANSSTDDVTNLNAGAANTRKLAEPSRPKTEDISEVVEDDFDEEDEEIDEDSLRRQIAEEAEQERLARDWGLSGSENKGPDHEIVERLKQAVKLQNKSGISVRRLSE